jgi:hypothetical protein
MASLEPLFEQAALEKYFHIALIFSIGFLAAYEESN